MRVGVKVKVTRRGDAGRWLSGVEGRLKGPTGVKVGFPGDVTEQDVLQKAVWNHYGTKGSGKPFRTERGGGFGGPIPPRPFILIAVFKHRSEIRRRLRRIYQDVLAGKIDSRTGLMRLGEYGQGIIQQTISQGVGPPNSPTTIRLKRSSKPLIDTGNMTQSVRWALDEASAVHNPAGRRSNAYRMGQEIGRALGRLARH